MNIKILNIKKMKTITLNRIAIIILVLLMSASISACKKDNKQPEQNLKGKIAPSISMTRDGDIEFYDLRDKNNPQKAAFNIKGNANTLTLEFVKSRPIGIKTIKADYGDLSINHNKEIYLADRNWANWSNISTVRNWLILNNDNTNQLYPAYQDEEAKTKLYDYANTFDGYDTKANWGKAGTINGGIEVYENYGGGYNTRNAFYFNFKTQEYLFQKDLNSSTYAPVYGYKITDLIKKPNGNMDTDPIDWTKTDFAFVLNIEKDFVYNNKKVSLIIFVDMDTKSYVKVLRNLEDDATDGADKGRQTLLTTSWQPLSNLIKGWDL
ncbi:MAG: hypothetical protein RJA25_955 [Bacteroidota bacterium]|jgi:hypothetical protein